MQPQPLPPAVQIETVGDVAVVRFSQRSILNPDLIEALGAQLLRLVDEAGRRKLVLNFAHVESMATAMVGKLVVLRRRVEAAGGRLVLCQLDPFLLQIFKVLNLTDAFPLCADEPAALGSF